MRYLALLFMLALTPIAASAQYLESQNVISAGKLTTQINSAWSHKLGGDASGDGEFGVSNWMLTNKGYSEALVGFYLKSKFASGEIMEAHVQIGTETAKSPWRVRYAHIFMTKRVTNVMSLETGGSGKWYLFDLNVALSPQFGVGGRYERFVGIGPRFQVGGKKLTLWAVPAAWDIEHERRNHEFGLQFTP